MTFSELKKFLESVEKKINPVIEELLVSHVDPKNREAVNYQILTGGKRLRPALAVASCRMFGGKIEDVLYPAAALEILHNYTLIIDDIIDKSVLRRGKSTCWFKFGKSIAHCIEIDYSATIFQGAVRSKKPEEITEILAKAMKVLTDGEILDILFEQAGRENEPFIKQNRYRRLSNENYFEMVGKKTAALIQASCETGGLLAGAAEKDLENLKKYGFNFGLAFQIQDDILDIFGEKKSFGKRKGQDIADGKMGNIVILLASRELPLQDKKRFMEIISKGNVNNQEVKEAVEIIKKTSSFEQASNLGKKFIDEAKKSLDFLPKNEGNDILRTMADFVVERKE